MLRYNVMSVANILKECSTKQDWDRKCVIYRQKPEIARVNLLHLLALGYEQCLTFPRSILSTVSLTGGAFHLPSSSSCETDIVNDSWHIWQPWKQPRPTNLDSTHKVTDSAGSLRFTRRRLGRVRQEEAICVGSRSPQLHRERASLQGGRLKGNRNSLASCLCRIYNGRSWWCVTLSSRLHLCQQQNRSILTVL